jgi:hypothetical protein
MHDARSVVHTHVINEFRGVESTLFIGSVRYSACWNSDGAAACAGTTATGTSFR